MTADRPTAPPGAPHLDVRPGPYADLLARPGVEETLTLRSALGVMAFHGGALEQTTDVIAVEVAERVGASYYGVTYPDDDSVPHLPSTSVRPDQSAALTAFVDHVDEVVTVHGYGRANLRFSILLGGRHRPLARHLAGQLRADLPDYDAVDDLDAIPKGLRGQHARNPVNLVAEGGVQIELPPTVRWNWDERGWSDRGGISRPPHTQQLIESLVTALTTWSA